MNFVVQFVIAIVLAVLAYMFMPKPKLPKSESSQSLENPTAEAGRPVPVVFGDVILKDHNCLWYGDISKQTVKVKM